MDKKYFETRKGSLEDKINTIAAEQPSISKPQTDVKLSVEKKYFETKKGSLEDLASKLVEEKALKISENPLMALGRTAAAAAGTAAGTAVGNKIGDKITSQKKYNKEDKDPCWKDYKMVGMKNKGGKEVPNCVPDKDNKIPKQKKQNEAVTQDDKGEKQNAHKKDFVQLRQETKLVRLGKNGKTDTGEKAAVIDLEPSARPI